MQPASTHADIIRDLNDRLRRHGVGGMVVATAGLQALGSDVLRRVRLAAALFDEFHEGNDPYGEHDFGRSRSMVTPCFSRSTTSTSTYASTHQTHRIQPSPDEC